jgi:hypothetical protein
MHFKYTLEYFSPCANWTAAKEAAQQKVKKPAHIAVPSCISPYKTDCTTNNHPSIPYKLCVEGLGKALHAKS